MSCASKHPCYICEARYENGSWEKDSKLRTCQSVIENVKDWVATGAKRTQAKNHKNCVSKPLLFSVDDIQDSLLITKSPPPSLHLKLGMNHVLKHLLVHWPGLKTFMDGLNIQFEPYHGYTLGIECFYFFVTFNYEIIKKIYTNLRYL